MKRRWALGAVVVLALLVLWYLVRTQVSLDELVARELELRATIARNPVTAFVVGLVIYTLVSLVPGTSGKSVICGWLFGFWQSLAMVTLSLTLAGLGGFSASRLVLGDSIRRRLGGRFAAIEETLEHEGAFYLLTVRMLHVPYTFVNYVAGASGVTAWTFVWTTFVGLIPSTMIFVGVGATLPTLAELREDGVTELAHPSLVAALILMGGAPWLLRWLVRRFFRPLRRRRGERGGTSVGVRTDR